MKIKNVCLCRKIKRNKLNKNVYKNTPKNVPTVKQV